MADTARSLSHEARYSRVLREVQASVSLAFYTLPLRRVFKKDFYYCATKLALRDKIRTHTDLLQSVLTEAQLLKDDADQLGVTDIPDDLDRVIFATELKCPDASALALAFTTADRAMLHYRLALSSPNFPNRPSATVVERAPIPFLSAFYELKRYLAGGSSSTRDNEVDAMISAMSNS